jgi:orotate phosphoribosyltransferase
MENVDSLVKRALELKEQGMSEHEIGRELHVSENTVVWLITRRVKGDKPPIDVKIGWRSMGVSATRVGYLAGIMSDIITEEAANRKLEPDTVVGVAINGIPIATMISDELGLDLAIYRPIVSGEAGTISSNFANVKGKQVVIVDDVTGTGETLKAALRDMRNSGAKPVLALVIVNKTDNIEVDGVPLRSLIRARPIS